MTLLILGGSLWIPEKDLFQILKDCDVSKSGTSISNHHKSPIFRVFLAEFLPYLPQTEWEPLRIYPLDLLQPYEKTAPVWRHKFSSGSLILSHVVCVDLADLTHTWPMGLWPVWDDEVTIEEGSCDFHAWYWTWCGTHIIWFVMICCMLYKLYTILGYIIYIYILYAVDELNYTTVAYIYSYTLYI